MPSPHLTRRRVLVLTVSDRCSAGLQTDLSGPAIASRLTATGATVETLTLPDDLTPLTDTLRSSAALYDLILTTGGTGLSDRDNTPEATLAVCTRLVPGLAELIRREGAHDTPFAALGRGVAGVCGRCLILNVPGSPKGALAALQTVLPLLPHALELLAGHTEH